MSAKLSIGLWGCGNMGNSLARALTHTAQARVAIAYDLLPEATAKIADLYGSETASSAEELLSFPGLAGVIVALPSYVHASATIQAARAGVSVFCEKPMALTVPDCQAMIDAASQNKVKLQIGQVLRYYEPYRSILRWAGEKRYGEVFGASIWRVMDGRRWAVEGYWRASRAKCGGVLYEVGAHEMDMLRCLLGRPQTVFARLQKRLPRQHEINDLISVEVDFPQGQGTYESGGGAYVGRYGFRIYAEQATFVSRAAFDRTALEVHTAEGQIELPPETFVDSSPVADELADWIAAIREECPVRIPGEEGLATVALIQAAYRSADSGQLVPYTTD